MIKRVITLISSLFLFTGCLNAASEDALIKFNELKSSSEFIKALLLIDDLIEEEGQYDDALWMYKGNVLNELGHYSMSNETFRDIIKFTENIGIREFAENMIIFNYGLAGKKEEFFKFINGLKPVEESLLKDQRLENIALGYYHIGMFNEAIEAYKKREGAEDFDFTEEEINDPKMFHKIATLSLFLIKAGETEKGLSLFDLLPQDSVKANQLGFIGLRLDVAVLRKDMEQIKEILGYYNDKYSFIPIK